MGHKHQNYLFYNNPVKGTNIICIVMRAKRITNKANPTKFKKRDKFINPPQESALIGGKKQKADFQEGGF